MADSSLQTARDIRDSTEAITPKRFSLTRCSHGRRDQMQDKYVLASKPFLAYNPTGANRPPTALRGG